MRAMIMVSDFHNFFVCSIISCKLNLFFGLSGGVTMFENGKLKCKFNTVEAVHGLIVERDSLYTIRNMDLSVHQFNKGKFSFKEKLIESQKIYLKPFQT